LQNARHIEDIKQLNITVVNKIYQPHGMVIPLHWFCVDKSGACVTIECGDGGVPIIYENPWGIMTNSPTFPEHIAQLNDFSHVSQYTRPGSISQGTGMIGLPGDFSSESRFIRLNTFQKFHEKPKNSEEGMDIAFHIMNNFDIVKGYVLSPAVEFTQYTVVYNIDKRVVKIKTYQNQNIVTLGTSVTRILFGVVLFICFFLLTVILCTLNVDKLLCSG
jgi:choloylglycine hydrolase